MRNLIAALTVAGAALAFLSTEASAWTCYAAGTTGSTGWATSASLAYARRNALYQCAIRTPRGARCYLTGCN